MVRRPALAVRGQCRICMLGDLILQRRRLLRANGGRATGSWFGGHLAGGGAPLAPPSHGAGADAKQAGGLGLTEPGVDGTQQPLAEVDRILLHADSLTSTQL